MTETLNILYSFPHRLGRSGIGTTAWQQVAALAELGHRVSVYCGTCERGLPQTVQVHETMRFGRWRLPYRVIGVQRAWSWHDRQVARALERECGQSDLVHTWPSGAIWTLRTARRVAVSSFLERPNTHTAYAYEVVGREMQKLGFSAPRGQCHRYNAARLKAEKAEFDTADCLLCPSDFVARSFVERGVPARKLGRHQYGYDPSRFGVGDGGDLRPEGGLRALFAGTCEPRKGLHLALEAWFASGMHLRGGTLSIAGRFARGYRELLGERLAHPSIRELGFSGDMASIMRRCDVLVLPSLEEGSALVSYEARACGCVLLVSDATGAIVSHGQNGLVHAAGDVKALTQHVQAVGSDPRLLADLRLASLRDVDQLTWRSAAERLESVYRNVLAGRREEVSCPA